MTKMIEVQDAQAQFPAILSQALSGDEIVITEQGKPVAKLIATNAPIKTRVAGLNSGAMEIKEDFDEPLPDEFWSGDE